MGIENIAIVTPWHNSYGGWSNREKVAETPQALVDWERFCEDMAAHYKGVINNFEFGNEINFARDEIYSAEDDNNAWFEKIKTICEKYGYTSDMKAYKENPQAYKGSITDVSNVIRVAVTGRNNSPDLCTVMKVLGAERVNKRILAAAE